MAIERRSARDPLRIALLSYRSKPHCGGQGVYVRHLSRELAALGHHVEVFSGQPYPELDEGPLLREVPSLDLYRDEDPFRTPRLAEYRDWTDVLETSMMWAGAFPEPLTFSVRALRVLGARRHEFDVVHDNQGLGYGLLGLRKLGLPLVASVHHPISVDRRIDLAGLDGLARLSRARWYGFVRMQARVARRIAAQAPLITVSDSAKYDICRDFRINPARVRVVPLGVDPARFRPRDGSGQTGTGTDGQMTGAGTGTGTDGTTARTGAAGRVAGRVVSVASADTALKGTGPLLRALAKLVTEHDLHLIVVGTPSADTLRLTGQLSLADRVTFRAGLGDMEYAELLASAEIAVVPSLYEGFSLPAVEHLASGTPLVASAAGALPEVAGDAALLVRPGDVEELAAAVGRLHVSPRERAALSERALTRVRERFTWSAVARATVTEYRAAIEAATAPC